MSEKTFEIEIRSSKKSSKLFKIDMKSLYFLFLHANLLLLLFIIIINDRFMNEIRNQKSTSIESSIADVFSLSIVKYFILSNSISFVLGTTEWDSKDKK